MSNTGAGADDDHHADATGGHVADAGDGHPTDPGDDHLTDVDDGCGCAEVWEHLSAKRADD